MTAFCSSGNAGDTGEGTPRQKIKRQPYAAGKFYTADSTELRKELKEYFEAAVPGKYDNVFGVLCPHAGYVYSGVVAASA